MNKKPASHHVVPNKNGGWDIVKGGAERSSKHCSTKEQATQYAREISRNQGTELYIHGKDGKIQSRDSHGNDPYPPRG